MKKLSLPKVISVGNGNGAKVSPREQFSNTVANIFEMQRQAHQVCDDCLPAVHVCDSLLS